MARRPTSPASDIANPTALLLSAVLMLQHLEEDAKADSIHDGAPRRCSRRGTSRPTWAGRPPRPRSPTPSAAPSSGGDAARQSGYHRGRVFQMDDITEAVLSRDEVARYPRRQPRPERRSAAAPRILEYLEELRTTQRYELYRALEYPLYPILRKIDRVAETRRARRRRHGERPRRVGVEPPQPHRLPRRAAGPGRCGRTAADHRGGHQPVRRSAGPDSQARHRRAADPPQHEGSRLPDHAQGLRRHAAAQARPVLLSGRRPQLLRRDEVTRRPASSAPASAPTCRACRSCRWPSPTTWCSRTTCWRGSASSGRQRAFSRELAEMVRYAVGYRSRAFVTFGRPIPLDGYDGESRRSVLDLAHLVQREIGRLYKVVPTAVLAAAMRPSHRAGRSRAIASRQSSILLRATGRQPRRAHRRRGAGDGHRAARDPRHHRRRRTAVYRVRDRHVLRYYGRSLQHLLTHAGATH